MPHAVVLAGGQGARLRPYTAVLPKPLLPIGDRPVLSIVIDQLCAHGFTHVTIATGYMGDLIEAVLNRRTTNGMLIEYAREATPLGTVGPLAMIEALQEEPFLVMNGDVLTDLDYTQLYADHVGSDAVATIATTTRQIQVSLGVLECFDETEHDRVTGYVEKPQMAYGASMGVYCFSPLVLDHIEPGAYLDLPELVLRLIERGETVRSWRSDAYWVDLGRREDYERAIADFDTMRSRLVPATTLG